MTRGAYVHGYSARETVRLRDQASALMRALHGDIAYPDGARVLEVGCGVGAQTITLARNSPKAAITSIDVSESSLKQAKSAVLSAGITNVTLLKADIFDMPFAEGSFDHVFVCFVLEHLKAPLAALQRLKTILKPGGTITVIEGDHGSAFFYPDSKAARRAIECLIELQRRMGGNALIGRQLYPLLSGAGFADVSVSPRSIYADSSKPELVEGMTKRTFIAMIEGARQAAISSRLIDAALFDRGIEDLNRAAEPGGVLCYTFFKADALSMAAPR